MREPKKTMASGPKTLAIGIDPGTHTGVAMFDMDHCRLLVVCSMPIHAAMDLVKKAHTEGTLNLVVFEDARMRTWFGSSGREKLQGAGSIKRDSQIWADFLADLGCTFKNVKPAAGATKWDAETFKRLTGWSGRTDEHGRDAALLVFGGL